ncbi:MAG: shikimate kinase [Thermodesulfovibrio sp.]|nr:shikimate kinase [Thermodesulfovibrio sp.]
MGKDKNIVLVGFMGTGKTTVGKVVAKKIGYDFVDVDEVIEKLTGMTIPDIFAQFGEARFRDIETEVIKLITKKTKQVIATGGGAVLREENIQALRRNGIIFCLEASEEIIFERVKNSNYRPLLKVEKPIERIRELLSQRKPRYSLSDFIINTDKLTVEEVAEKIINEFERLESGES